VCLGFGRRIAYLLDLDIWTYHLIKINNNKKKDNYAYFGFELFGLII